MIRRSGGFGAVELLIVIAVVVLVSGSGYLFYRNGDHATQTKPKPLVAESQDELINSVPTTAAAIASTSDLDNANQSINELDLDSNNDQLKQLDSDVGQD